MIYVEVLCTSGNEDDPFPSKQFQPTLRQTRSEEFMLLSIRSGRVIVQLIYFSFLL